MTRPSASRTPPGRRPARLAHCSTECLHTGLRRTVRALGLGAASAFRTAAATSGPPRDGSGRAADGQRRRASRSWPPPPGPPRDRAVD
jgi:hypothetical protein